MRRRLLSLCAATGSASLLAPRRMSLPPGSGKGYTNKECRHKVNM
jgi:hypothetical protein